MALTVNTNIINDTDQYLLDAKNVKGSYVVVGSTTERDSLPAATTVTGSLCYCTGDSKFYQYNGTKWVEKTFGSTSDATTTASGLMSAADKAKLDGIATEANKYEHPSTHAASMITGLATVATSGSYNDLTNKPTIPTDTNQKVKTGSVTFGANDTVEFVAGSNVSISGDATNKKITISSTDTDASYFGIGVCNGSAGYAAKEVVLPKFSLVRGASILLSVANTNTATSGVGLNVNNTGKKSITINGSAWSDSNQLVAGYYLAYYNTTTTTWDLTRIYLTDTTYSNATTNKAGLMSKTDKANLDTIVTSFSSDDSNSTIDTIKEVLKAFEEAPEGTNIINALAEKSDVGHNHEATTAAVLTGVKASGTDTFVKTINGGSGSLTSDTTTTDGIKYVESVTHTAATLSGVTTFNTDAIKNVKLSASTASADGPAYVESVTHTAATLGGTKTFVTGVTTGSGSLTANDTNTGIAVLTEVTKGDYTPAGTISLTNGTAPSMGAATTKYLSATVDNTSTNSGSSSGTSGTIGSYSNGVLTIATTVNSGAHTHTYDKATSVTLTANDATAAGRVQYVQSQGTFSAGTTPKASASFSGTKTNVLVTDATTKYLHHTHTSASSAGTGTVTISGGSITPVTKYMKKTTTAASTGTVGISGGSITPSTKYLHHTHTAASAATTGSAVTSVASNGTVNAVTAIADAEN